MVERKALYIRFFMEIGETIEKHKLSKKKMKKREYERRDYIWAHNFFLLL